MATSPTSTVTPLPAREPRTLDDLRAITDPAARARAVRGYITRALTAIAAANTIRRDAIADVLARDGDDRPGKTATACGCSTSLVKTVRTTIRQTTTSTQEPNAA